MADKKKNEINRLAFLRISLLGASGSGKTSLACSFVNSCCPARYTPTDKAVIYHRKVEVIDDGEWEDVRKPILVEVEDTPGSEKGYDEDGSSSRVILSADKRKVLEAFNDPKYRGRLKYRPAMDGMLGREFPVRATGNDGSIGLPSPDGSEGGVWNFPASVVKFKVSMDLPIHSFLHHGSKEGLKLATMQERKKYKQALQVPFSAYERVIGDPEVDKTLTRNRMGYFICFDLSDEDGESLKEAMSIYAMLQKDIEKREAPLFRPIVWLIGCKSDKTYNVRQVEINQDSAQAWSDQEELPFHITSARLHKNVNFVFSEMIQAISSAEGLWTLDAPDDVEGENGEEASTCRSS
jgi:hypothetical protein